MKARAGRAEDESKISTARPAVELGRHLQRMLTAAMKIRAPAPARPPTDGILHSSVETRLSSSQNLGRRACSRASASMFERCSFP